jgi:hypothetical protein
MLAAYLQALSIDVDRLANLWRCVGEATSTTNHVARRKPVHASTKPPALWVWTPAGQNRTSSHATKRAAAAHADPTSPTGAEVRDWNETLGLTKKSINVDNIIAQPNREASDAAYMRSAAKTALLSGYIGAGAGLLGGIGQGLSGLGGGAPSSMPKGYNPNSLSGLY